jgi:hypothetical protein
VVSATSGIYVLHGLSHGRREWSRETEYTRTQDCHRFRVQKLHHSFLAPLTRCATEPEREIFRRTRLCLLDVAPSRPVLINI